MGLCRFLAETAIGVPSPKTAEAIVEAGEKIVDKTAEVVEEAMDAGEDFFDEEESGDHE